MRSGKFVELTLINAKKLTYGLDVTGYDRIYVEFAVGNETERSSAKSIQDESITWNEMFSFTFDDDCVQKLRCLFYLTSFKDPTRRNRKIGYCTVPFRSKKIKFISGIPLTFVDYPVEGIPEGCITMSVTPKNFGEPQPKDSTKKKHSNLKEMIRKSMRLKSPLKLNQSFNIENSNDILLHALPSKYSESLVPKVPTIEMSHGRMQKTNTSMKVHDMKCKIRGRYAGIYTGKVGPFKKGSFYFVPHGFGLHQLPNNTMVYEGYFNKGKRCGRGKLYLVSNQDISINGIWKNDEPLDSCKIRYPNEDIYCGTVKIVSGDLLNLNPNSFQKHGFGTFLSKEGNFFYCGQYTADVRDGIGICDYINKGERYIGLWKDDHYEGEGCYNYVDGSLYYGSYLHGKKYLDGTYYLSNGYEIKGHWTKDQVVEKIELHEGKYNMISENVLQMIENELKGNLLSRRPSTDGKRSKCLWSSLLSVHQLKSQLVEYMWDQKLTQRFSKQLLYSIIEDKNGHLNEVLETFCEYFSRVNSMKKTFGVRTKTIRNKLLYAKDDVASFLEYVEDTFFEVVQILAKEKKMDKRKSLTHSSKKNSPNFSNTNTPGGYAATEASSGPVSVTPVPQTPSTPVHQRVDSISGSVFDVVTVTCSSEDSSKMKELIHSCFSDYVQRRIYPILFSLYENEYREKEMILEQKIRAIHHALEAMTKSKRIDFLIRELEEIENREPELYRKLEIMGLKSLIVSVSKKASTDDNEEDSNFISEELIKKKQKILRTQENFFLRYCLDSLSIRLLNLKDQNKHLADEIDKFSFELVKGENKGRELIKKIEYEEIEEIEEEEEPEFILEDDEEIEDGGEFTLPDEEISVIFEIVQKEEEEEVDGEDKKEEQKKDVDEDHKIVPRIKVILDVKEFEFKEIEKKEQAVEAKKPEKKIKIIRKIHKKIKYEYNERENIKPLEISPDKLVRLENQLKSNRIGLFALFQTEKLNVLKNMFENLGKTSYVNFQMESFSCQVESCLETFAFLKDFASLQNDENEEEENDGEDGEEELNIPPPTPKLSEKESQLFFFQKYGQIDQLKSLTCGLESLIIDFNSLSFPSYLQIAEIKKSVNQRVQSLMFGLKPYLKEDDPIFSQLELCNKGSITIVKRKSKKLEQTFKMLEKQFELSKISYLSKRWRSIYRVQQISNRFQNIKYQFMNIITQIESVKMEIENCLVLKNFPKLVKSINLRLSSIEFDIDYVCGLDEEYLKQDKGFIDFTCGLMKKRVNTIRIILDLFISHNSEPSKFLICFNVMHNTQMAYKCLFLQMKYFNVEDEVDISLKEFGIVKERMNVNIEDFASRIKKLELGKQEVQKMKLISEPLIKFEVLETIKMVEIGTKAIEISLEALKVESSMGTLEKFLNVHEVSEVIKSARKKIIRMAKEKKIDCVENGLQYIHPTRSTDFSQIPLKSLGANDKFIPSNTNNPYNESLKVLNGLKERKSFFEKMQVLNEFESTLNNEMKAYSKKVLLEEDDILPIVLYIFLKADLNHYAEYHYLDDWKSDYNKMLMRYDVFFKYVQNLDPYARSVQGELLSISYIITALKNTLFQVIKERNTKIELNWLINLFNFIYCEIGFLSNTTKLLEINNKKLKQSIMDNFDQVQLIMSSSGKSIGFSIHIDTEFDDKLVIEFDNVYSPNIYKWCAEEILKDIKDYLN